MSHIKLKNILKEVHQNKLDEGIFDIFKKLFPSRPTSLENLTPEQRKILRDYTGTTYHHINRHLRSKYGTTDLMPDRTDKEYDPKDIEDKIGVIASAFTEENTNQRTMIVYTGIPPEFGEKLVKSVGQTLNFPGFTSTSARRHTGLNFGELYSNKRDEIYVIKCICPPNTILDIQSVSRNPQEEEHIINYGAKFKVTGYEVDTNTYPNTTIHEITIKLLGEQVSYK